jgi:hypothetical protein
MDSRAAQVGRTNRNEALQARIQLDDAARAAARVGHDANQRKDESKETVIRVDDFDTLIDRNPLPSWGTVIIG